MAALSVDEDASQDLWATAATAATCGYCVAAYPALCQVVPSCVVFFSGLNQELIAKMAKAMTKEEFVSAFESRLGDITLLLS